MNLITDPEIERVSFSDTSFTTLLRDGRTLSVPYMWFPRLLLATPKARRRCTIAGSSLSWEIIDEDISISALLAGKPDSSAFAQRYWAEHPEHDPRPHLHVSDFLELSIAEAAKRMNISRQRLTVLVKEGRVPARKFGKQYFVQAAELNLLVERKIGRPKKVISA